MTKSSGEAGEGGVRLGYMTTVGGVRLWYMTCMGR